MKNSIIRKLVGFCIMLLIIPLITFFLLIVGGISWIHILITIFPSVLFTIFVSLYIKRKVIKPLDMLEEEAYSISSGDLSHQITYRSDDEIGRFVYAFDHMRDRLYQQQKQQLMFEIERKNFVNSISHDLKTPIASISAYIEALQDQMATTPEEEQQYLKVIEDKLTILAKLSSQLSFSYAAPEELNIIPHQVICFDFVSNFYKSIESECRIRKINPNLRNLIYNNKTFIMIDKYQFDRALENVVSNSYRYTKNYFSITAKLSREHFILEIENDGITITPNKTNKIFDRFYSEEESNPQGHLGLGLYITKTIIQAMEGTIEATIHSDRIVFRIVLPIYKE